MADHNVRIFLLNNGLELVAKLIFLGDTEMRVISALRIVQTKPDPEGKVGLGFSEFCPYSKKNEESGKGIDTTIYNHSLMCYPLLPEDGLLTSYLNLLSPIQLIQKPGIQTFVKG